ncbi:hypothetical protein, partial [Escherichia coli]
GESKIKHKISHDVF